MDLLSYRDEFPVLDRKSYLISASLGPVSDRSRRYLDGYLDAWATKGAPDHVWFEDIFPLMRALKTILASPLIDEKTPLSFGSPSNATPTQERPVSERNETSRARTPGSAPTTRSAERRRIG